MTHVNQVCTNFRLAQLFVTNARVDEIQATNMSERHLLVPKQPFRAVIPTEPIRTHLTECTIQMVLESHIPRKIENLLFTITNQNNELTVLWGS